MGKIIKNGKEYKFGTSVGFQTGGDTIEILTQAEYDELVAAGATDDDIYYFIEDEKNGGVLVGASNVSYDNSESGMAATDVQGAVDELNTNIQKVKTYVGEDGKIHFVDSEGADSVLPFRQKGMYHVVAFEAPTNMSVSIVDIVPDYKTITAWDFYLKIEYVYGVTKDIHSMQYCYPTIQYDPNTGIVSCSFRKNLDSTYDVGIKGGLYVFA